VTFPNGWRDLPKLPRAVDEARARPTRRSQQPKSCSYGEAPLKIDALADLQSHNDAAFRELYPGVIAVGGNGGLETYALDYRGSSTPTTLVAFDAIAGLESVWPIAGSFAEALDALRTNYLGPWQ
jgi:hypothetical protein